MDINIRFVLRDQVEKHAAMSTGFNAGQASVAACPYVVGDFVQDRNAPGFFFKVTGRVLKMGDQENVPVWKILLEACPNPFQQTPHQES